MLYRSQVITKFKYYAIRGDSTNETGNKILMEFDAVNREDIGVKRIMNYYGCKLAQDMHPLSEIKNGEFIFNV